MAVSRVFWIPILCLLASAVTAQTSDQSREPFDNRYCMSCHGVDGIGNVGVQAPRLAGMEPWYLERQLKLFRDGLRGTHPKDIEGIAMQPMAAKLSDQAISELVDWVGSWDFVPAPGTVTGNVDRGEALYSSCATCHGPDATGNQPLGAPALAGQNDWYLVTQLQNFKAGYRGSDAADTLGSQMRIMAQGLGGEQDIVDVVSYINSLD